jgi:hypothetical protein
MGHTSPQARRALLGLLAMLGSATEALAAQPAQPAPVEVQAEAERTARKLAKTHEVARCLVRDFRQLVVPILEHAPGSDPEQMGISQLRRRGLRCVELVSELKNGAAFVTSWDIAAPTLRGALAEALYEADFSGLSRLRPRDLARVAPAGRVAPKKGAVAEDFGDLRRFAACAVRSAPEDSASLLASEPGSAAETGSVRGLVRNFDACFPADATPSLNVPNVRGLVAEAMYRHRSALALGEPAPGELVQRRQQTQSGAVVIVPAAAVTRGSAAPAEGYDAEDVRKLAEFSRCIARQRPADAVELLTMDYREEAYYRMARWIAGRSMACVPRGKMRFSRLLFAGGLAEEMLVAKPGGSLAAKFSAGPAVPASQDGDFTHSVGFCLARSEPASVAGLLATLPASAEENQVVRDITPHIARCVAPGRIARIGQPSLRAIAAIAAYQLQQQAAASRPGRG